MAKLLRYISDMASRTKHHKSECQLGKHFWRHGPIEVWQTTWHLMLQVVLVIAISLLDSLMNCRLHYIFSWYFVLVWLTWEVVSLAGDSSKWFLKGVEYNADNVTGGGVAWRNGYCITCVFSHSVAARTETSFVALVVVTAWLDIDIGTNSYSWETKNRLS